MKFLIIFLVLFMLISCGEPAPEKAEPVAAEADSTEGSRPKMSGEISEAETTAVKPEAPEAISGQDPPKSKPTVASKAQQKEKSKTQNKAVLWRSYRQVKSDVKKAEAAGDYQKQVKLLLQAADLANQLERKDIEAWQYNNAGYALINDFKQKTDYYKNMSELNNLVYKSEIEASRKRIKAVFSRQQDLLERAKLYLLRAEKVDSSLEESPRTNTIQSNLLFVNDVMKFVGEQQ